MTGTESDDVRRLDAADGMEAGANPPGSTAAEATANPPGCAAAEATANPPGTTAADATANPPDLADAKRELRRRVRACRRQIAPAERSSLSQRICRHLLESDEWRSAASVMLYLPLPEEVDIMPLVDAAYASGKTVLLPRIDDPASPAVHPVTATVDSIRDLVPDALGIQVPAIRADWPADRAVDLVVVPGIAFDRSGNRMGMGKGCYDRWLSNADAGRIFIACAFALQIVPEVPAGPLDARIDALVTEDGFLFKKEHMCYNG